MSDIALADTISEALLPYSVKQIANDLKCAPKSAENWKLGENAPNATRLIQLMNKYETVRVAILKLVEPPTDDDLNQRQLALEARLARLEKLSESNS